MTESLSRLPLPERIRLAHEERQKILALRQDWDPNSDGQMPIDIQKEINEKFGLDKLSISDCIEAISYYLSSSN